MSKLTAGCAEEEVEAGPPVSADETQVSTPGAS